MIIISVGHVLVHTNYNDHILSFVPDAKHQGHYRTERGPVQLKSRKTKYNHFHNYNNRPPHCLFEEGVVQHRGNVLLAQLFAASI